MKEVKRPEVIDMIVFGSSKTLRKAIKSRARIDFVDPQGFTPLHYAAHLNKAKIVRLLIDYDIDINTTNTHGDTALHTAAATDAENAVDALLEAGVGYYKTNNIGQTALHVAATHGSVRTIETLKKFGREFINAQDLNRYTAAHHAAFRGQTDALILLIDEYADLSLRDIGGRSVIHWACSGGSLDCLDALVNNCSIGSDILSHLDDQGRNALHYAIRQGVNNHFLNVLVSHDESLLRKKDHDGCTALHYAARYSDKITMQWIVELYQKDDLLEKTREGLTSLHIAAFHSKCSDVLDILLSKLDLADLSSKSYNGRTALHMACECKNTERIARLIDAGADLEASDFKGYTALHIACIRGDGVNLHHLLNAGANPDARLTTGESALHVCAVGGSNNVPLLQELVASGCPVDAADDDGRTPLMIACSGHAEISESLVLCLLELSATLSMTDSNGWTSLHYATANGNHKALKLLMDRQEFSEEVLMKSDSRGMTALHYAAQLRDDDDMTTILLESCPQAARVRDVDGFLPLHYAALKGHFRTCDSLLQAMRSVQSANGADLRSFISTGDPLQLTLFHLAAMKNHQRVIEKLKSHFQEFAEDADKIGDFVLGYRDQHNRSALYYAMRYGNAECVMELLEGLSETDANIHLSWMDNFDISPLFVAAANGHNKLIDELIIWFPSLPINKNNSLQRTCGMVSLTNAYDEPNLELMYQSNIRMTDKNLRGYLHRAAYSRNTGLVNTFLPKVEVDARDLEGVSPLHLSAWQGDVATMSVLLSAGASLTARDCRGMTAADWAAANGQGEALEWLLDAYELERSLEADSQQPQLSSTPVKDERRDSTLQLHGSSEEKSFEINVSDVDAVAPATPVSDKASRSTIVTSAGFLMAARGGHLQCVTLFVERKLVPLESVDSRGISALHFAAARGHPEVVDYLIDKGAKMFNTDTRGCTPLMMAVRLQNSSDVVDMLIEKSGESLVGMTAVDIDGNNALHLASIHKNEIAATKLVEHLSKVDGGSEVICTANNLGQYPLHIIVRSGLEELLSLVAPLSISCLYRPDKKGRIPLCAAVEDADAVFTTESLLMFMIDAQMGKIVGKESLATMRSTLTDRSSERGSRRSSQSAFLATPEAVAVPDVDSPSCSATRPRSLTADSNECF